MRDIVMIRGTFAVCACGADLNVRSDVGAIAPFGNGLTYRTLCPQCSRTEDIIVSADTHRQALDYLRQVAKDKEQVDIIKVPVNEQENLLQDWANALNQMGDEEILARFGGKA